MALCNWEQMMKQHMTVITRVCNNEDLCRQMENAYCTLTGAKKNCLESQAPNVINKFRKILQRFIFLCHYVHRDLLVKSEYDRLVSYEDLLSAILSQFIESIFYSSNLNLKEKCSKIALSLFLFIGSSPLHLLNCILMSGSIDAENVDIHVKVYRQLINRLPTPLDDKCFLRLLILTKHLMAHMLPERHHEIRALLRQISLSPDYENQFVEIMESCNFKMDNRCLDNPVSLLMTGKITLWKKLFKVLNKDLDYSLRTLINSRSTSAHSDMSQSTLFFVDRKALGNDRSHDISEEAIDPDADSQSETQVPMFHLKPKESGNVKQINQEKKTCTQEQSYTTKEGDDCEGIDFTPLDSPMQTSDAMNKISLSDQKLDSKVLQRENTEENVELEVVSKPKTQSKAKNRTAGRKSLSTTSYNGSLIGILKKANKFLRIKRRHKDINSDGNHKPDENTENILTEFAVADEDISKSSETFHFSSDESKETSENSECGLSSMVRDCKIPSNSVSALTDHLRDINKASSQKRRHQSGNTMLEMQKDLTVKKLKKANSASDKIEKCGDHEVEPSGFSHDLNILCIDKMELKKSPNSNNTNKFKDAFIGEQASPKGHLSAGKPLEKQSEKQVITDKGVSNNINAEINHNENRNHSTESLNKSPDPALSEHLCETKQEGAKNSSLVSGIPKSIEVNAEKTSPSRSFHRKLNFISSNKRKAAKRIEDSSWRVEEGICIKNSDESKSGSDMSSRGGNDKLETDGSSSDNSGKVDRYVKKHTRLSDDNFDTHVPRKCRREPKLRKNRQTFKMEDFIDDECVEDNRLESDMSVNSQDNYLSDEDFLTLKESRTRSSNSNLDANLYSSGARTTSKKKLKSVQRHSFIDDECSEDNRMESDMSSNSHSSSVNSESSFNNSETNNVDVTKNPISDGESGLNLQVKTRKEQSRVDIDGTCSKDSDVESQDSFINDEILSDDYSENSNIGSEPDATSCSYEVESVPDWGHKRNRKGEQQKNKKKKMAKIESSSDDTPVKTKLVRHLVSSVSPSKVRNDESSPKKNDTQIEKNRLPLSSEIVDDPGRSVEKDKTKEGDSICSPGSTLNNDISSINKHNNGINSEKSLKHSSKNVRYEEVKDSDDVCDFVFQTPIVLIERSAEPVEDLNLKSKDHQIQRQYPDEKCEEPCSPENRTLKVYTPVVCIKNIDKVDSVDDVVVNAREKTPDGVTRLTRSFSEKPLKRKTPQYRSTPSFSMTLRPRSKFADYTRKSSCLCKDESSVSSKKIQTASFQEEVMEKTLNDSRELPETKEPQTKAASRTEPKTQIFKPVLKESGTPITEPRKQLFKTEPKKFNSRELPETKELQTKAASRTEPKTQIFKPVLKESGTPITEPRKQLFKTEPKKINSRKLPETKEPQTKAASRTEPKTQIFKPVLKESSTPITEPRKQLFKTEPKEFSHTPERTSQRISRSALKAHLKGNAMKKSNKTAFGSDGRSVKYEKIQEIP